jgi:hypothetical protein
MNIDQIIQDLPGVSISSLLEKHKGEEIFFSTLAAPIHASNTDIDPSKLRMQFVDTEHGRMGLFYASKEDARLGGNFAGMKVIDAARMMHQSPGIDGMIVYGKSDAWLAFNTDNLQNFLSARLDQ